MTKDYGIVSICVGISLVFLWFLLARAFKKWRERRAPVARDLTLHLFFIFLSFVFYLWSTLIQALDPWGWGFYVQVTIFTLVNVFQVVAYYILYHLTAEIWPPEHAWYSKVALGGAVAIIAYLPLSLINDWGLVLLPNNNHDFTLPFYLILLVYLVLVLGRGLIQSIKAIRRVRHQLHVDYARKADAPEARQLCAQLGAMNRVAVFFLGNLVTQVVITVVDSAIGFPPLFYASLLLVPVWILVAFRGFFPKFNQ